MTRQLFALLIGVSAAMSASAQPSQTTSSQAGGAPLADRTAIWVGGMPAAEHLGAPPAGVGSAQDTLVLVPLPQSLWAASVTLGVAGGVGYMRRRRIQRA